jgi:purine-nucleoside phosphorylase
LGFAEVTSGTYVCIPGPSLETPAETRYLRLIGADAVGMSSVPEILVAIHAGLRVLGLSVVANVNDPDHFQPILLEEIIAAARAAEPRLQRLIIHVLENLPL